MALSPTTIDNLKKITCLICCVSVVCSVSLQRERESHYVVPAVLKLMVSTYKVLELELYATLSGVLTNFEIPFAIRCVEREANTINSLHILISTFPSLDSFRLFLAFVLIEYRLVLLIGHFYQLYVINTVQSSWILQMQSF